MKSKKRSIILVIMFLISIFLSACNTQEASTSGDIGGEDKAQVDENKIHVFVSILPQADFVKNIGGEKVKVSFMIPPGANPEHYEFTSAQLKGLAQADIYIQIGHIPVEKAWMDRIVATNPNMIVVDSSQDIKLHHHDPHIWLSPKLVKIQAEHIAKALMEYDQGNNDYYQENLDNFIKELDALDKEIKDKFAKVEQKKFIVYHPAWGYFAHDYGLSEIAIEDHGKEASAQRLAQLISDAKAAGIKVVFTSPQHSSHSAKAIAAEIGGEIVLLDPLPEKYIADMLVMVDTLVKGMKR